MDIRELIATCSCFLLLLLASTQQTYGLTLAENIQHVEFGEGDIIYFIVTDRFMNGDPTNDDQEPDEWEVEEYQPGVLSFHQGGDWRGIIQKFDYIKNLGVTAIWISPVVLNQKMSPGRATSGYHGYWAKDFYEPDPHFGSMQDLKELVQLAHQSGMSVILDHMLNHTGDYIKVEKPWDGTPRPVKWHREGELYRPAPPFDNFEWYHHYGDVQNWWDPFWNENGDLYGLDDLNHENPAVVQELIANSKWWVEQVGFDAFRLDAAKHFPKWFLREFTEEIGLPCFGEVWIDDPRELADYEHHSWSMIDFPFYYAAQSVFIGEAHTSVLHDLFAQDVLYNHPNRLVTLISSQDFPRFMSYIENKQDYSKLKLALAFLLTCRGSPMIYYGDEQGFYGGKDPANREPMFDPHTKEPLSFNEEHEVYRWIQKLCTIKKLNEPLKTGKQHELYYDRWVYSFSRVTENGEIIIAFNNSRSEEDVIIPLREGTLLGENDLLLNLLREENALSPGDVAVIDGRAEKAGFWTRLGPKELKIYRLTSREELEQYASGEEVDRFIADSLRGYESVLAAKRWGEFVTMLSLVLGTLIICGGGAFLAFKKRKK